MKLGIIAPTALLEHYAGLSTYHLMLANLALQDRDYLEWYQRRASIGDFVLLDNGAWEGETVSTKDLKELCNIIEPNEVALPDVMLDGKNTVKVSEQAAEYLRGRIPEKTTFMAIPQGPNFSMWRASLHKLMTIPGVTTIGLARNVDDNFLQYQGLGTKLYGRALCLKYLEREGINDLYDVHLLGWGKIKIQLLANIQELFPWVRGMDTTQPVKLGLCGIEVDPEEGLGDKPRPRRKDNYFDVDSAEGHHATIVHNICVWKAWCQCE